MKNHRIISFKKPNSGTAALAARLAMLVLALGLAHPAAGADALLGFDPGLGSAANAVAVGDGVVYLGGSDLTTGLVGGRGQRSSLVAVDPRSGALLSFHVRVSGTVRSLLLVGRVLYVGGDITDVGGIAVSGLGAIDTALSAPLSFSPALNGGVMCLASDGATLWAGGQFTRVGATRRGYGAAWSIGNGRLTGWDPNANGAVNALATLGTRLLVGGDFTALGGGRASYLAITDQLLGRSIGFDGRCDAPVRALWAGGGRFYAAGDFTSAGGAARGHAAAWNAANNALVAGWDPHLGGRTVSAMAGYVDRLFLGGRFRTPASDLVAVDLASGAPVANEVPAPDAAVACLGLHAGAPPFTLYLGGGFLAVGGQNRGHGAAIDIDHAPTGLALAGATVANGAPAGTVIGTFSATDLDPGDTLAYRLTSSANGLFGLSGNQLVVANPGRFLAPAPSSYTIAALVTDADGKSCAQSFVIAVRGGGVVPAVSWTAPAGIVYGTALGSLQLDATANVPGTFAYSPAAGAILGAGTHALSVTFTPSGGQPLSASTTISVAKAALTVTAGNAARPYGAANPAFTASYSGFVAGDTTASLGGTLAFATSANAASPVGGYAIVPSGLTSANYAISYVDGSLSVMPAVLTVDASAIASTYGAALPPLPYAIVGFVNGDTAALVSGAPVLSTTATASSPVGAYADSVASVKGLTAANYSFVAGAGAVLTITPAALRVSAANASMVYGSAAPALVATYSGFVNGEGPGALGGAPALATAPASSPVGSYAITVAQGGISDANYSCTFVPGTLSVTPAALSVTAVNATMVYGGALPALSATIGGFVNGDGPTAVSGAAALATTATSASQVGSYAIVPSQGTLVAANYSFAFVDGALQVTPAALSLTAVNATMVYGGALPALSATIGGYVNGDGPTAVSGAAALATIATSASPAGSYAIVPSQGTLVAANYSFAFVDGALLVTPAALSVTPVNATMVYGGALPALSATIGGYVNGDGPTAVSGAAALATIATSASPVGSYAIVPSQGTLAAANYSFAFVDGALLVTPAALNVSADNQTMVYGAAVPALTATISGYVNGDGASAISGAPALSANATSASPVGGYAIMAAQGSLAAANYTFTLANGTLTITPAVLTVTAGSGSMVYGGAVPALTAAIAGYVNGDGASAISGSPALSTIVTNASPVGSYPVVPTVGSLAAVNYTFAFVAGAIVVAPAPMTVTAADAGMVYGGALPALSATCSGFVNGEGPSVLGGSPALATAAATSPVGSYAITPSLGTITDANYAFTFIAGTLTVTPATVTVAANDLSMPVGGTPPALTYAMSGFVNGDTAAVVSGAPTLACGVTSASPIGVYVISVQPGTLSSANYAFTCVDGTLSVTMPVLQVIGCDVSMVTGSAVPALSVSYVGFLGSDTPATLGGRLAIATTATSASPAGAYPVIPSGLTSSKYEVTFVPGQVLVLGQTVRGSLDSQGGQLSGPSWLGSSSSLSIDGSILLFASDATNLSGGALGLPVAYQRVNGVVTQVSQGEAIAPSMSGDGAFVAYGFQDFSLDNEPVAVGVYDRAAASWSTESRAADGTEADSWSGNALISDDGRWLAFETMSTMLTGAPSNDSGFRDIILRDRVNGTNTVVSAAAGVPCTGNCRMCALSPDGRYVAFCSTSPVLLPGTVVPDDVPYLGYLYDASTGTLTRIDLKPDGSQPDDGVDFQMSFSSDDRFLAFASYSTDLVPGLTNGQENVFVRDLTQPLAAAITCADISPAGVIADQYCYAPVLSGDGRYLAFLTMSAVFDPSDTAGNVEAFLADRLGGQFARLTLPAGGGQSDDDARSPISLSRDASTFAWFSYADNLVGGDSNQTEDVFEIQTGIVDAPPAPNGDG